MYTHIHIDTGIKLPTGYPTPGCYRTKHRDHICNCFTGVERSFPLLSPISLPFSSTTNYTQVLRLAFLCLLVLSQVSHSIIISVQLHMYIEIEIHFDAAFPIAFLLLQLLIEQDVYVRLVITFVVLY